jgi:predicted Zn-dependent protease
MTAAWLLAKMGHGAIADGTMRDCLERYSKGTDKNDRYAALEAFAIYALGSNRPSVAQQAADEILAKAPDNVSALLVKMYAAREAGNRVQTAEHAKRVLRLTKPASPAHRAAAQLLGVDPNIPADRTPPAGPR